MDLKLAHFSSADSRPSHSPSIVRSGDKVLVIHDLPVSAHVKPLLWIMAGAIPVIAVVSVITSQSFIAVLALILVFLGSIAFMSRQTITEINLADRMLRTTWKIGAYAGQNVYLFDDFVAVEVKDKDRMIEGYSLPFFSVQLVGRGKEIAIYSTDDPVEAKAIQAEVAAFLKQSALSTQRL